LRDTHAASAKQSILKNRGAVKPFLLRCGTFATRAFTYLLECGEVYSEIPVLLGRLQPAIGTDWPTGIRPFSDT